MSRTRHHGSKAKHKLFGRDWNWWKATPKAWNKTHHIRPRRAQERQQLDRALRGEHEQVWPLGNHKPHEYYW